MFLWKRRNSFENSKVSEVVLDRHFLQKAKNALQCRNFNFLPFTIVSKFFIFTFFYFRKLIIALAKTRRDCFLFQNQEAQGD